MPRTLTLHEAVDLLGRVGTAVELFRIDPAPDAGHDELAWWLVALQRQYTALQEELEFLAPWALPPAAADWWQQRPELDRIPTLSELAQLDGDPASRPAQTFASMQEAGIAVAESVEAEALQSLLAIASGHARERIAAIEQLARQATAMAWMEYEFLYDRGNHLLAIGYNVSERRRDNSYYDLLASEARLASFVAIAQGQLPQESWFALGPATDHGGRRAAACCRGAARCSNT